MIEFYSLFEEADEIDIAYTYHLLSYPFKITKYSYFQDVPQLLIEYCGINCQKYIPQFLRTYDKIADLDKYLEKIIKNLDKILRKELR